MLGAKSRLRSKPLWHIRRWRTDGASLCYGPLTTSSAWEATISCDGLLCSFDIHVGLESLQGTLIEPDQTTAGSIQISDQRNDQRDSDGEKNQRQPKARCQR